MKYIKIVQDDCSFSGKRETTSNRRQMKEIMVTWLFLLFVVDVMIRENSTASQTAV